MQYAIIIEKAGSNYSAYAPDLPGCITTGQTAEETKSNMAEAIAFHIEGMREDGTPIPEAVTFAASVDVAAQEALMRYRSDWDLSSIPEKLLFAETGRRRAAMRVAPTGGVRPGAGRKPKMVHCRRCAAVVTATESRRGHDGCKNAA